MGQVNGMAAPRANVRVLAQVRLLLSSTADSYNQGNKVSIYLIVNAHPFTITDYILVIGGYKSVELLPLKSGAEQRRLGNRRLGNFPKKIRGAVGTTLGEFVINSTQTKI